jgi:hypothetical protein
VAGEHPGWVQVNYANDGDDVSITFTAYGTS